MRLFINFSLTTFFLIIKERVLMIHKYTMSKASCRALKKSSVTLLESEERKKKGGGVNIKNI